MSESTVHLKIKSIQKLLFIITKVVHRLKAQLNDVFEPQAQAPGSVGSGSAPGSTY